jgi:hypothetical protein
VRVVLRATQSSMQRWWLPELSWKGTSACAALRTQQKTLKPLCTPPERRLLAARMPSSVMHGVLAFTLCALGFLEPATSQWVDPSREDEVHYNAPLERIPAVGMTANGKAGLTVGFAVTWFLLLVLFILVTHAHSFGADGGVHTQFKQHP